MKVATAAYPLDPLKNWSEYAEKIEQWEAEAAGQGVAVVDGRIVENLHVETARALLAKAETIEALEAEMVE